MYGRIDVRKFKTLKVSKDQDKDAVHRNKSLIITRKMLGSSSSSGDNSINISQGIDNKNHLKIAGNNLFIRGQ